MRSGCPARSCPKRPRSFASGTKCTRPAPKRRVSRRAPAAEREEIAQKTMSWPSSLSSRAAIGNPKKAIRTSSRRNRGNDDARGRFLARLAQKRCPHGVLDELPELLAVRHTPEKSDRNAEAALVAPPTAIRPALLVDSESLLEP